MEKLKDSLLWKENEKLREWLNTTWLPTSRVSRVESKSYFCSMCEVGVEIMSDVCCASMIMHYFEHVISIM